MGAASPRAGRAHAPLNDLCDLSLPVRSRLLPGRQSLQLILQVSVLSCEFVHKGAKLKLTKSAAHKLFGTL